MDSIGPLGSDAAIALAETTPFALTEPGSEPPSQMAEARRSRHQAVVLLTRGTKPGLFLMNADAFSKPSGPPMLQISSAEACGSNVYHNVADRWPEAVDVATVTRYARAFANGAREPAQ
jgi:hypothetical protein